MDDGVMPVFIVLHEDNEELLPFVLNVSRIEYIVTRSDGSTEIEMADQGATFFARESVKEIIGLINARSLP